MLFRKIGELKKLVEEGKIKYIGLSEASASKIRRARHPSNNSCAVGMVLVVTRCGGRDCSYLQVRHYLDQMNCFDLVERKRNYE